MNNKFVNMKKYYLFIGMIIGLISCNDDSLISNTSQQLSLNSADALKVSGDGTYAELGYGYDITDDYMGQSSVKLQVIDVNAFVNNSGLGYRFHREFVGTIDQRVFYGATAMDYLNEITTKSNYSGSIAENATKDATGTNGSSTSNSSKSSNSFSGSITNENTTKYSYSAKYSFGRADIVKRQNHIFLDVTTDVLSSLSNYLTQSFQQDLQTLSADQIVSKYGTHVLLDINEGGMYKGEYKSSVIATSSTETKNSSIEAGLKLSFNGVGLGFTSSQSTATTTTLNQNNTDWSYHVLCLGGTTNGVSETVTATTPPTTTFNYSAWLQSVDDTHSRLVDVNWNAAYPIYAFVADPVKKAAIKAAVGAYVSGRQISQPLPLTPLYRYYKTSNSGHLYTTDWSELGTGQSGFSFEKIQCYVFSSQITNTIPLYRYYNTKNGDHLYTTDWSELGNGRSRYSYEGVQCYVYSQFMDNTTVPLYRYYNTKNGKHFYTTDASEIAGGGYSLESVACYVCM